MSERSRAAQALASRGRPVLPVWWATPEGTCACGKPACDSPAKHPITRHGVEDASIDRAVILHWWGRWPQANIGMATGRPSGLFVLDMDPRHDGWRTLAKLCARDPDGLTTLEVETGGGGLHLYFSLPDGLDLTNSDAGIRRAFGSGIDCRGTGGYVIAPPSVHPSGCRYRWIGGELRPAPDWLVEILTTPEPARPEPARLAQVVPMNGDRLLARFNALLEDVARQAEGNRNKLLFWAACRLREYQAEGAPGGWTDLLIQAGVAAGLDETEARRAVRSGLKGRAS
jgi:hypothetical protein